MNSMYCMQSIDQSSRFLRSIWTLWWKNVARPSTVSRVTTFMETSPPKTWLTRRLRQSGRYRKPAGFGLKTHCCKSGAYSTKKWQPSNLKPSAHASLSIKTGKQSAPQDSSTGRQLGRNRKLWKSRKNWLKKRPERRKQNRRTRRSS